MRRFEETVKSVNFVIVSKDLLSKETVTNKDGYMLCHMGT